MKGILIIFALLALVFMLTAAKCETNVNTPDTTKEEPNKEGS